MSPHRGCINSAFRRADPKIYYRNDPVKYDLKKFSNSSDRSIIQYRPHMRIPVCRVPYLRATRQGDGKQCEHTLLTPTPKRALCLRWLVSARTSSPRIMPRTISSNVFERYGVKVKTNNNPGTKRHNFEEDSDLRTRSPRRLSPGQEGQSPLSRDRSNYPNALPRRLSSEGCKVAQIQTLSLADTKARN
uniref:Uncharacterized protein n=1 Tax=Vespula pensylvanica TaxID=30213 RepID=A0A834P5R9_VESPE|nr:hypothetical protein H0235_005913 [Vespula pensylvanica]